MKRCLDCGIRIAESSPNVLCEFCISLQRGVPITRKPERFWPYLAIGIVLLLAAIWLGSFIVDALRY